jgi:shikimate kinase
MGQGYYDPHPRLTIARPLVLMGHPGSGAAAVARALCGRTGLPLNHVERLVEAAVGRSRAQLVVEEGVERLREVEWSVLQTAVRRLPPGVVTSDAACLATRAEADWLRNRALLVHLSRPDAVLFRRIRVELEAAPGSLPDFVFAAPQSVDELSEHLAGRAPALGAAHVIFDAGERHPLEIAGQLLEDLEELISLHTAPQPPPRTGT